MTALEAHIEFDLAVKKLNSSILRSIQPQEKDILLNYAQRQFIKNRINPKSNPKAEGFEDNNKRYEDIRTLLVTKEVPVYVQYAVPFPRYQFSYFPANLFLFIESTSIVEWNCNTIFGQYIGVNYTGGQFDIGDGGATAPFFSTLKIEFNTQTVFDIANYPNYAGGVGTKEEKFSIINLVHDQLLQAGYNIYWERARIYYAINKFLLVDEEGVIDRVTVTTASGTVTYLLGAPLLQRYLLQGNNTIAYSPNRLIKSSEIERMLTHSLYGTKYNSPISEIEKDQIKIYNNRKFIVSATQLRYIRKPRQFDLLLNQSFEVSENVQQEVVDIAAQRAKALLSDPSFKEMVSLNSIQE